MENEPICQASVNAMLELQFPHSSNVIGRQFSDEYVNYMLSAKQAQKTTDLVSETACPSVSSCLNGRSVFRLELPQNCQEVPASQNALIGAYKKLKRKSKKGHA